MKIALYKGRKRLISKAICLWTQSPYSHCELVFSDGMCGSSHDLDRGVRLKKMDLDPAEWDFFQVDVDEDEAYARAWFEAHCGRPYDYLGLLAFVFPLRDNPYRWTCAKAVMTALQYKDAWKFEPGMLALLFKKVDHV